MPGFQDKGNKFESHLELHVCIEYKEFSIASVSYLIIYFLLLSGRKVGWFPWHINLCGLSNVKAILVEEQKWYYSTYSWWV